MRLFGVHRASHVPPRAGRLWRWVKRVALGAAAAAAILALAAYALLHSLDRPWVKKRVSALARAAVGVDVDYRTARMDALSGLEVEDLVVRSPAAVHALAPDLARVDRVFARWRWGALVGHSPALESLRIEGVALTVVVDARGRTSFDFMSSAPEAEVPLSRKASDLLGARLPVDRIDAQRVTIAVIRADDAGAATDRLELRGVALVANVTGDGRGSRVNAAFGAPAAPLDLVVSRAHGGQAADARARAWLSIDASASAMTAAIDVRMAAQTFAPSVSADHWLHAEASLGFDPKAQRTSVKLDHVDAGDGALSADASLEIPDSGAPLVRHAQGEVDVGRILGWLPPGLAPATAERAHVRFRIESLVAAAVPDLAAGGSVDVDADVAGAAADLAGEKLAIERGTVSLHAEPSGSGGFAGRGSCKLGKTQLTSNATRLVADDLDLDAAGKKGPDGAIAGDATLRFSHGVTEAPAAVTARDGEVQVHVTGLRPAEDPLATTGDLTLTIGLASLDARSAGARVIAEGLTTRAHAPLDGHAPYAAQVEAKVSRLRVLRGDGPALVDAKAHIAAELHDVVVDRARPDASRGVAHATVDLGDTSAAVDVTKGDDSLDYALRAAAPTLAAFRPLLAPALAGAAPWERMGAVVRSSGRAEHLRGGATALQQSTELDVERPRFGDVAAEGVVLAVHSTGTALRQEVDADLRARALTIEGDAPRDDHVALRGSVDRERRSLHVALEGGGRAATRVVVSLAFDPARRAVPYEIDVHLAELAPLAPLVAKVHGLEGFDLSALDLGLSARGTLLGVVADVGRDGGVRLEAQPSRTAGVEGEIDLRAAHLAWAHGDAALATPAAEWHGELHSSGAERTVKGHLTVGALHVDLGARRADFSEIKDESSLVVAGDLADPDVALTQRTAIRTVRHDALPGYPIGDVTSALTAERERDGLVHVSELELVNGAGGTRLAVSGNVALGTSRRMLSVTATLGQDLSRLAFAPAQLSGRGALAVEATVTSPNLALFRIHAALKAHDVSLAMPGAGIDLEAFNGEIPITVAVLAEKSGVALRSGEKRSPYSMLRFTDQHPLLKRSGYVSIGRLRTRFMDIAPLVGNVEVEQNVVSLRQFEMGVRGGTVTGQCGLEWDGPRSTLELHVRASGVQSSHGEPFDGNIAVVIGAGDRTVEGRAEILRIGERHLRDLLDMEDPMRVDPAMNRVRSALAWGYPDRLRLVFNHGFASAHLELGGLARLISIGEIRGIPMGPIVDKLVAPVLDPKAVR